MKCTVEFEKNGKLAILDVLGKISSSGKMSMAVFRKTKHYVTKHSSHRCPSQKLGIFETFLTKAKRVSDQEKFKMLKSIII